MRTQSFSKRHPFSRRAPLSWCHLKTQGFSSLYPLSSPPMPTQKKLTGDVENFFFFKCEGEKAYLDLLLIFCGTFYWSAFAAAASASMTPAFPERLCHIRAACCSHRAAARVSFIAASSRRRLWLVGFRAALASSAVAHFVLPACELLRDICTFFIFFTHTKAAKTKLMCSSHTPWLKACGWSCDCKILSLCWLCP